MQRQQEKRDYFERHYGTRTAEGLYETTVMQWAGGERGLLWLRQAPAHESYPADWLDPDKLVGKSVLDVGTGDGVFVTDLLKETQGTIDIVGIDREQNKHIQRDPIHFKLCDAQKTGFQDNTFDTIYVTWSVFTYDFESDLLKKAVLLELARVLKPGGTIRMTPVNKAEIKQLLNDLKTEGSQLAVSQEGAYAVDPQTGAEKEYAGTYLELKKNPFNRPSWLERT